MPKLLLSVKKAKWNKESWPDFLVEGEVPADCFKDLRVENNRLSVWLINDEDADKRRIITALAAKRDFPEPFDILLFEQDLLMNSDILFEKCAGATPDQYANDNFHRDIIQLSGGKLLRVATSAGLDGSTQRIPESKVVEWIKEALSKSELDPALMKPTLRVRVLGDPAGS